MKSPHENLPDALQSPVVESISSSINVLIVEDQNLVAEFVRTTCDSIPGFNVVHVARTGQDALTAMVNRDIDLVILDISLPDFDGLRAVQLARRAINPKFRVLVMTSRRDQRTIDRVNHTQCHGFIGKNTHPDTLKEAIYEVGSGRTYYCETYLQVKATILADPFSFTKTLSDHEQEILEHIALRRTDAEIGYLMGISDRTVDTHRTNIAKSLGIDRTYLVSYALSHGFGYAVIANEIRMAE